MSEVKSVSNVILEIATNKEYKNSAIAQWYNRKKKRQ